MSSIISRGALFACLTSLPLTAAVAAPRTFAEANAQLVRDGSRYAIAYAEYFGAGGADAGNIVYFDNRGNKQLAGDFVPGLALDGTDAMSYYVDDSRPSADVSGAVSGAAIRRAMSTWDAQTCSSLGVFEMPFSGPSGFVAAILGFGGSTDYFADVVHSGWMDGAFFDSIAPNGAQFILGVTFTIIFVDGNGDPVDSDNNGKYDVAFREIYFNDAFHWQDGARFDIETVALHEAGHGLSQAHFGKAFRDGGSGALHFAPRAVMNAAYSGVQTELKGTDNAGHCSNWSEWPES
jgi:hypothetical protein